MLVAHDHHRVGHRHPAGEHADRRARRHVRPRPALPDPRARRPQPRARLRVPAVPERGRADRGGDEAPQRALSTTPSSAPASRSRCATSRSAAPATCSATSSPATSPRSASSSTCRCSTRRCAPPGRPTATSDDAEPVRLDVNVDAYVPADYIPYEQAKIDVHRRIAGAREVADLERAARRARGPLRPGARAAREPARAPAGAHQARPGRARARSRSAAGGWRSRRSSSTRRARSGCARSCRTRSTSRAARRSRCASRGAGGALPGRRARRRRACSRRCARRPEAADAPCDRWRAAAPHPPTLPLAMNQDSPCSHGARRRFFRPRPRTRRLRRELRFRR